MLKLEEMSSMDDYLNKVYIAKANSHKGQNGKLLLIGGSKLFHAASLWALKVASRIVDLVHYASVPENNTLVQKVKDEFRDGIVIPRSKIEDYIEEDDCILIGPGMLRTESSKLNPPAGGQSSKPQLKTQSLENILNLPDEGAQTYFLTEYLLKKYPYKKWVIDAGALQMMELEWIPKGAILTPHRKEFEQLSLKMKTVPTPRHNVGGRDPDQRDVPDGTSQSVGKKLKIEDEVKNFAQQYNCIVLLKGEADIICAPDKCEVIKGGNAGMTKGGTGDVLAGLVAALNCKNDPFISTVIASFISKKAGESLFQKVGYYFNASDLTEEIPKTMKEVILRI